MEERLQKILSECGICSRRKAEEYITAGRVKVNGLTAHLGDKADLEQDIITFDNTPLGISGQTVWLMLNKPRGYVTTLSDEKGRKTVAGLVKNCGFRVWPVGRLDRDSEGLLLFTNDGEGTHHLIHPKHEIEKEYFVTVRGNISAALPILDSQMVLDGEVLAPARVKCLSENADSGKLSIVIHQGKNRQVRRMCAMAGLEVRRLQRIREGKLSLGKLPIGAWRFLTAEEVDKLFQ